MENPMYKEEIRYEILNGKIVNLSPRPAVSHIETSGNIYRLFANHLRGKPCKAYPDGVDLHLTDNDLVIPDGMIVCSKEIVRKDGIYGSPDLIVEVLSPSTVNRDRGYKKDLYERCGVKEYWIVDTANRSIEVYLLKDSQYHLDNTYIIYPSFMVDKMTDEEKNDIAIEFHPALFPELTISLADVFEDIFEI